jgi:protein-L-isoaspartate(D-aspartate) O-methyltransferase
MIAGNLHCGTPVAGRCGGCGGSSVKTEVKVDNTLYCDRGARRSGRLWTKAGGQRQRAAPADALRHFRGIHYGCTAPDAGVESGAEAPAMLERFRPGPLLTGLLMLFSFGTRDPTAADADRTAERDAMVSRQLQARDITDTRVLEAMRTVQRHLFVPQSESAHAYADTPLPIGEGQTISQPYIVALMTQLARPGAEDRVLEVGTGSGYQAAVLAKLVKHVWTIELEPTLAKSAGETLRAQGYSNVTVRAGDGYAGWPDQSPFDIIVVTAAPDHVPQPLIDQLARGGRMVVPVGGVYTTQELRLLEKDAAGKVTSRMITPVRFVPLRREP